MRGIHWFRNDLRLRDNTAMLALADRVESWLPVFVIDERIASGAEAGAARLAFLADCLERLGEDLEKRGIRLHLVVGRPERELPRLMAETGATLLSWNDDVTPFARERDAAVREAVERDGGECLVRRDHVVFGSEEIRTGSGTPYAVYTPYRNAWWKRWHREPRHPRSGRKLPPPIPGFTAQGSPARLLDPAHKAPAELPTGGEAAARRRLDRFLGGAAARYAEDRDRPDLDGTSRLSPYLRFGVLSPRQCFARAENASAESPESAKGIAKWLDELIWREFYAAILAEHPHVLTRNHRSEYDALVWNDDPEGFDAWCEGRTGYPIVDAGMRQLRATGWMHNRVRMIVASFLTKDLLIDWRHGERFFFRSLVDGDPASNNGGWQWAASTGTDAQPYFRIFNPVAQGRRFDPDGAYVRRWVPELAEVWDGDVHAPWEGMSRPADYPAPIVDHKERRELALERYQAAREAAGRK